MNGCGFRLRFAYEVEVDAVRVVVTREFAIVKIKSTTRGEMLMPNTK